MENAELLNDILEELKLHSATLETITNNTTSLKDNLAESLADTPSGSSASDDLATLVSNLNDSITLQNDILVGIILFLGVIAGILFMQIFWQRFKS